MKNKTNIKDKYYKPEFFKNKEIPQKTHIELFDTVYYEQLYHSHKNENNTHNDHINQQTLRNG